MQLCEVSGEGGAAIAVPGLVKLPEVVRAAHRISRVVRRTPLIPLTPRVSLKAECLQVTGSFKLRGAYNAIAAALEEDDIRGVVTHSSGNHAQGVARAARLLGLSATAVMPCTTPPMKRERVARDGAEVIEVGTSSEERVEVARELSRTRELLFLSSTEHPQIIAGQGTVGLEVAESYRELREAHVLRGDGDGAGLEVLVPIGGGGLASGVGLAIKSLLPRATVVGVEPALAADARQSLEGGRVVRWPVEDVTRTIADGLQHTSVGALSFSHLRVFLDRIVTVSEAQIKQAIRWLAAEAHLVVEPSGAVSVAAYLAESAEDAEREHTVCVVSGGNVDLCSYVSWLEEAEREVANGDQ
jgi:threo-3-hydroxy-L-aspartate ammonia-lyase